MNSMGITELTPSSARTIFGQLLSTNSPTLPSVVTVGLQTTGVFEHLTRGMGNQPSTPMASGGITYDAVVTAWLQALPAPTTASRAPTLPDANFFDYGGTSISAIGLMSQLQAQSGKTMPFTEFFQHPTLGVLVEFFTTAAVTNQSFATDSSNLSTAASGDTDRKGLGGTTIPAIHSNAVGCGHASNSDSLLPGGFRDALVSAALSEILLDLSHSQQSVLIEQLKAPGDNSYNLGECLEFAAEASLLAFRRCSGCPN